MARFKKVIKLKLLCEAIAQRNINWYSLLDDQVGHILKNS